MSTEHVMKRKQAQRVDDHTNTAVVKRFCLPNGPLLHYKALWIKSIHLMHMMYVTSASNRPVVTQNAHKNGHDMSHRLWK